MQAKLAEAKAATAAEAAARGEAQDKLASAAAELASAHDAVAASRQELSQTQEQLAEARKQVRHAVRIISIQNIAPKKTAGSSDRRCRSWWPCRASCGSSRRQLLWSRANGLQAIVLASKS